MDVPAFRKDYAYYKPFLPFLGNLLSLFLAILRLRTQSIPAIATTKPILPFQRRREYKYSTYTLPDQKDGKEAKRDSKWIA